MATSVDSLIGIFRDRMDDNELPALWSDDRIVDWFDEAQREFARVTHIFKDTASLAVTADSPYTTMPEDFLEYRTGRSDIQKNNIVNINLNEANSAPISDDYGRVSVSDWMDSTGAPTTIILDIIEGQGRLVPIPVEDDNITMFYSRYPKKTITASSSKTELVNPQHQKLLVTYARAMAYDDQDSDVFDSNQAAKFMQEFLNKLDVYKAQITNSTRRAGTVKYGGI